MLDNDPRYLRPESRVEMSKRLKCLAMSPNRRKRKASKKQYAALGYDSKEVIKNPVSIASELG